MAQRTNMARLRPLKRTKVTSHQVTLSDLTAGTEYYFECQSKAANGTSVTTPGATFTTSKGTTPPPPNAIEFVQVNATVLQTSENPVTVAYASAQTAADLNVVVVSWYDSVTTVQSVTDSSGNAYSLATGPTILSGVATQSIYYAKNIAAAAAGKNTVTVEFSESAPYVELRALEYSGADPVSPLDVAVGVTGTGTTASSGAITTTSANDLLFGANYVERERPERVGLHQPLDHQPGWRHRRRSECDRNRKLQRDCAARLSRWCVMQMAAFRRFRFYAASGHHTHLRRTMLP